MLLSLAGCGGGAHQAPRTPARSLVIPPPSPSNTGRPRLARAGTVCGRVTTVRGGHARVIIARGVTTCAEAMQVMEKYSDPNTPAEGTAGLAVIGRWTCETRTVTTTCTYRRTAIQARG
jgi:hypothetical protein